MLNQHRSAAGEGRSDSALVESTPALVPARPEPGSRPTEVLLVCSANICRSTAAEALLRRSLAALGSDVVVQSAGLSSGGQRADPVVAKTLRRRGARLRDYRSTTLTLQLLSSADLVLGMAVEHVESVVLMAPERWPRVFTVKELIRRNDAVGGRRPEENLNDWLTRLHAGRVVTDLRRSWPRDDIADPTGRSPAAYETMVNEVAALARTLADVLAAIPNVPLDDSALHVDGEPPFPGGQSVWPGQSGDLAPEGIWSERLPPLSIETMPTADEGDSPGPGPTLNQGLQDGDDDVKERPMESQDLDGDVGTDISRPSPDDSLRPTREGLQEAQRALTEAAQQLVEVLGSVTEDQPRVPADAYTKLGDEVAEVMRTASTQSSVVRDDAERYAHQLRAQAEADALTLRERAETEASEVGRKAQDESADTRREADAYATALTSRTDEQAQRTLREAEEEAGALRAEAATERQNATTEASDLRQAATSESAALHDEADRYARRIRRQAESDAVRTRMEADRHAGNVRGRAVVQSTEMVSRAEHDAAAMRLAAEDDARSMRSDAEREAAELLSDATARYAELVVAESELRSSLEKAAGALVSALEGRQHLPSPALALEVADDGERQSFVPES